MRLFYVAINYLANDRDGNVQGRQISHRLWYCVTALGEHAVILMYGKIVPVGPLDCIVQNLQSRLVEGMICRWGRTEGGQQDSTVVDSISFILG